MKEQLRKRKAHFKNNLPRDPQVKRFGEWLSDNRAFYADFREWLMRCSYGEAALNLYGVAARTAIGYLDKPYWTIDPQEDLERVWRHLQERPLSEGTKRDYHKGVKKLAEYLRLRCQRPSREKPIHWERYLASLPPNLKEAVQEFTRLRQCGWSPERKHEMTISLVSHLTQSLRWFACRTSLEDMVNLTPQLWFEYVDARLEKGLHPSTINGELFSLQHLLHFLDDQGVSVCERMLLVEPLDKGQSLHRDVLPEHLVKLQQEIHNTAQSEHRGRSRAGQMDLAWFLLMLHSGLRTREVRLLKFPVLNLEGKRVFIEQSKGLKDRLVYLSQAAVDAIAAYLEVRGPKDALPEQVFIYAHKPLSRFYCGERLHTYGRRCGVDITPHQLRHSAATLLLNAGAPVLTVQLLLGHKYVDTTLKYARLYDGTVAADYYQAMAEVERRLALPEDKLKQPPSLGELLALVDSLKGSTLNPEQAAIVWQLRNGIASLTTEGNIIQDVKVPTSIP